MDGADGSPAEEAQSHLGHSRRWQLLAAMLMMAMVSPYQYVWSSIEGPLGETLAASPSLIGSVFTVYVVVMAVTQFPAGWYRDQFGPRKLSLLAGILGGLGYVGTGMATSIWHLLVAYGLGAAGVGIVYTIAVNTAVKWYPDRPGLTTGLGTMAFGIGGVAFIPFVRLASGPDELTSILIGIGVVIFLGVIIGGWILRDPPAEWTGDPSTTTDPASETHRRQYHWREVIRTWQFWLLFGMFVGVSAAGLMITARIVLFTEHLEFLAGIATAAAIIVPIASGSGRFFMGWVSDRFKREYVMAASFLTCGLATVLLIPIGEAGVTVVYLALVAVAVFTWSSQFSLFPSLVTDYYGTKHSSTNYALVYSGKLWGGIFGGTLVGALITIVGWELSFGIGGALALLAGVGAFALRSPRTHR